MVYKQMTENEEIIIEFITKTEGLAYCNRFGVCTFCGGAKKYEENSNLWKGNHNKDCLYSRALKVVLK